MRRLSWPVGALVGATPSIAQLLAALLFLAPRVAVAQGPSAPRLETLKWPEPECTLPECHAVQSERRRSRLGHSVLVGALIGAGVSLLTAPLVYGICRMDDSGQGGSCQGKTALVVGIDIAVGAAIGMLVGASEPSRGPVPAD